MTGMRSKHDEFFKHMMAYPEVAKDFFATRLPENIVKIVDLDTLKLENTSLVDIRLNKHESDILYSVRRMDENNNAFLYILSEHQSESDPLMPFRLLYYMMQFLKRHVLQNKKFPLPLPLIYPLVIYNGKAVWSHEKDFFNLFGDRADLARRAMTEPVEILDVCRMEESELQQRHLSNIMLASLRRTQNIKELEEKAKLLSGLLLSCYVKASSDMGHAVLEYTTSYMHIDSEDNTVYWAILKEGFSLEYQEVIMNLKQATINQGIQQGIQQEKIEVARNMIREGVELPFISKVVELPLEQLKTLEKEERKH